MEIQARDAVDLGDDGLADARDAALDKPRRVEVVLERRVEVVLERRVEVVLERRDGLTQETYSYPNLFEAMEQLSRIVTDPAYTGDLNWIQLEFPD